MRQPTTFFSRGHLMRNALGALGALLAMDVLLVGAAKARFKRARLILD